MNRIKGISVILVDKIEIKKDPFGASVFEDKEIIIENVLITPTSSDDIVNQQLLYGKKAVYTLAIPKNDIHSWEDKEVRFFNQRFKVFGKVIEGIESMIPLDWNKKVMVERYGKN